MNLEFGLELNDKLKSQTISSRILLDKLKLLDEESRKTSQYQDPSYLPFYYHLGKFIKPKFVVQIGLNLGLEFCCFIQSCKSVDNFFGFQNKTEDYYSNRLAFSNIKLINRKINLDFYHGNLYDQYFINKTKNIDFAIITEKNNFDYIKSALDICWNNLNLDGYLLLDYLNYNKKIEEIFYDFCKAQNTEGYVFRTRYLVGIAKK